MTRELARTPLDMAEARVLTDEVRDRAQELWFRMRELYQGAAHTALGYSSWADYCAAEFDIGKSRAYQMLDAARVAVALPQSAMVERVARELVPVLREDPARVPEAWAEVVELHGPKPTASQTAEVVKTLKGPATDKQLDYLASLAARAGVEVPAGPISKARASKLIDTLNGKAPRLEAGPWLAKLRKLVEDLEAAVPVGAEFIPAQPLVGRLARLVGGPLSEHVGVPGRERTDDELQALIDAEASS